MGDQHVVPLNDDRKHYLADYCWCHPDVIDLKNGTIYNHNALDKRAVFEKERLPTGRSWGIYNMDTCEHGAQV